VKDRIFIWRRAKANSSTETFLLRWFIRWTGWSYRTCRIVNNWWNIYIFNRWYLCLRSIERRRSDRFDIRWWSNYYRCRFRWNNYNPRRCCGNRRHLCEINRCTHCIFYSVCDRQKWIRLIIIDRWWDLNRISSVGPTRPPDKPPQKNSLSTAVIIVIVVLVILLAAVAIFCFRR
jgi:hypothetical protein